MRYVRHPLQELVVDTFVPNDAMICGGAGTDIGSANDAAEDDDDASEEDRPHAKNSIVVCTGANACGKVTLIGRLRGLH